MRETARQYMPNRLDRSTARQSITHNTQLDRWKGSRSNSRERARWNAGEVQPKTEAGVEAGYKRRHCPGEEDDSDRAAIISGFEGIVRE